MEKQRINQPRNRKYTGKNFTAELKFNTKFSKKWNERFEKAQKFVDGEVLRLSEPLVPFQTGMLINSGDLGTKVGSGEVRWITPYAHYQYCGVALSRKTKKQTGKKLVYHGGPNRGSFWFHRMKAANKEKILAEARKIASGKKQ
jgi:hypothetical protein